MYQSLSFSSTEQTELDQSQPEGSVLHLPVPCRAGQFRTPGMVAGRGQLLMPAQQSVTGMCCTLRFRFRKIDCLSVECGRSACSWSCVKGLGGRRGRDRKINRSLSVTQPLSREASPPAQAAWAEPRESQPHSLSASGPLPESYLFLGVTD